MTEAANSIRRALAGIALAVGLGLALAGIILGASEVDQGDHCGSVFGGSNPFLAQRGCNALVAERFPFVWICLAVGVSLLIAGLALLVSSRRPEASVAPSLRPTGSSGTASTVSQEPDPA